MDENGSVNVTLSATDVNAGQTKTYSLVGTNGGAGNGTATIANNVVTYTPSVNYYGSDSFTFRVTDNGIPVLSSTAVVSITVNHVNQPVANSITNVSVNMGQTKTITVTATDVDLPDDTLTYSLVGNNGGAALGTVTINGNVVTYVASTTDGSDSINFRVTDAGGLHSDAVINITILPNNVPVTGTRASYLTFTPPDSTAINWNFVPNTSDTYNNNSKTISVDANTGWTVSVAAMAGINGHMTSYNPNTQMYESGADAHSLQDPLHIQANGYYSAPGGVNVPLSLSAQTLASASMTDFQTLNTYVLNYGLTFSQLVKWSDPGLLSPNYYRVVAIFNATPSY